MISISPSGQRAEGKGVEPSSHVAGNRFSKAARQAVSAYLPVDLMGVEPIAPTVQRSVAARDMQAHVVLSFQEVRPGIEPGLPPYYGGVLPKHLQTSQ